MGKARNGAWASDWGFDWGRGSLGRRIGDWGRWSWAEGGRFIFSPKLSPKN